MCRGLVLTASHIHPLKNKAPIESELFYWVNDTAVVAFYRAIINV